MKKQKQNFNYRPLQAPPSLNPFFLIIFLFRIKKIAMALRYSEMASKDKLTIE